MNLNKERNNCAIYCRLSKEDGDSNISQSISNQKNILTKYALDHNFNIFNTYVDDGFTGTNFNRPAFKQMLSDIESGLIDIVITKDLSRLGRDYLETGRYIERIFPEKHVRYIAINDAVDTNTEENMDLLPFRNILNEYYAKDISKKIRATKRYQREAGIFTNSSTPLYGYLNDDKLKKRIINPDTAPIVSKIYDLFINGYSLQGICDYLYENNIESPKAYWERTRFNKTRENPNIWNTITVRSILLNPEYKGSYIKGKTYTVFKTKKNVIVPKNERYEFKNVFDPIVTEETFDLVQSMFVRNRNNSGISNPYAGIVFCGICGKPLRIQRHKSGKGVFEERLVCSNNNEIGKGSIILNDLNEIIKNELLNLKNIILNHKDEFIEIALKKLKDLDYITPNTDYSARMININNRMKEIDKYIEDLFKESILQGLPDEMYGSFMNEYIEEKKSLEIEYEKYQIMIDALNEGKDEERLMKFINRLSDLDDENYSAAIILRNLISKIMITTFHEGKGSKLGKEVIIYYKACDSIIKEFINTKE